MSAGWKADELLDREVLDRHGDRIGRIERVYLDAGSADPAFVAINTGLLSRSPSVIPLAGAVVRDGSVVVPLDRDRVKGAPAVEPAGRNGGLSLGQERALLTFYDVSPGPARSDGGRADTPPQPAHRPPASQPALAPPAGSAPRAARAPQAAPSQPAPTPHPAPAPQAAPPAPPGSAGHVGGAPADDDAMTRSEERLHVHTENRPQVRAVLRKHVVTEDVQVTVPVSREEFRVEYEPITDDGTPQTGPAEDGAAPGGDPEALTLHAEQIVVRTESVPVERVRLATDRVTEEQTVTDQVRKERIELDDPSDGHTQR